MQQDFIWFSCLPVTQLLLRKVRILDHHGSNLWIFVFVITIMNECDNCSSVFLDSKVATVWAISWNNLPFPLESTEAVGPWVWSKWLCVLSIWQEWWMELQVQGNRGLIGMTSASLPGQTWHTRDQWIMVEEEFDRLENITFFSGLFDLGLKNGTQTKVVDFSINQKTLQANL